MVYKVSYVVLGGAHPGAIINQFEQPKVGGHVKIGKNTFEIVEVNVLMPARGDFAFLHATVKQVGKSKKK